MLQREEKRRGAFRTSIVCVRSCTDRGGGDEAGGARSSDAADRKGAAAKDAPTPPLRRCGWTRGV